MSIEDKIKPVGEVPTKLKVLLYGRSGTGKTTFIGTMPKPALIIDVREDGTTSVRNSPDVFVLSLTSWDDFEEAYWYLASEAGRKYQTVAVDTVTQLQEMAIAKVTDGEDGAMTRRSWGEASGLMKTWLAMYRDLPMHVVLTAQDRETANDEGDEEGAIMPVIGPYAMPSVAKACNAMVDVIGNTFIREREIIKKIDGREVPRTVAEYCLRVGPHSRYVTKIRRAVDPVAPKDAPRIIVSPTFDKIMRLSMAEEK